MKRLPDDEFALRMPSLYLTPYEDQQIGESNMEVLIGIIVVVGIVYYFSKKGATQTTSSSYTPYWKQKYGHLSVEERKTEYRRRGKSPSGVIDGVYNDMYREDGRSYSDAERDWDADA
jgi:hypothetical protein